MYPWCQDTKGYVQILSNACAYLHPPHGLFLSCYYRTCSVHKNPFPQIWCSRICLLYDCLWFLLGYTIDVTKLKLAFQLDAQSGICKTQKLSPICEYRWSILIPISFGMNNFFRHYYFVSFPYISFFWSDRFLFASWFFDPSGAYLFAFKYSIMLEFFPFLVSSIILTPFFCGHFSWLSPIVSPFDMILETIKIFLSAWDTYITSVKLTIYPPCSFIFTLPFSSHFIFCKFPTVTSISNFSTFAITVFFCVMCDDSLLCT